MYYFMIQAHSGWQYLASLALVAAVAFYVVNWLRGQTWGALDRRIGLYAIIVIDIQLLLGLTLWGVGASMGIVGANVLRTVEHPSTMLLAVVLLHAGWVWTKRSDETVRLRSAAVTFLVAGLLVLLGLLRIWGIV